MAKFMSNGVCIPFFPSSPRNGTKKLCRDTYSKLCSISAVVMPLDLTTVSTEFEPASSLFPNLSRIPRENLQI